LLASINERLEAKKTNKMTALINDFIRRFFMTINFGIGDHFNLHRWGLMIQTIGSQKTTNLVSEMCELFLKNAKANEFVIAYLS